MPSSALAYKDQKTQSLLQRLIYIVSIEIKNKSFNLMAVQVRHQA